jgi:glutathione synthase
MLISASLTEKMGYPDKACSNSIIHEALNRGHKQYAFRHDGLLLANSTVFVNAFEVFRNDAGELFEAETPTKLNLADIDVVHIRVNPPYDMTYISSLYILAQNRGKTMILNNPEGILLSPEKFIYPELSAFMPETLVTADRAQILDFWKQHGDVIVKPLYEFAGRGVFRLMPGEENYKSILQMLLEKHKEPLIVQKYIPEVKHGDKRILFFDGEYIGAFSRIPPEGQLQAAFAQGGSIHKTELTAKEKQICEIIKPILKARDIFCCGIDVIGDYLTEINTTCPSGITPLEKLYGENVRGKYWDMAEAKLKTVRK